MVSALTSRISTSISRMRTRGLPSTRIGRGAIGSSMSAVGDPAVSSLSRQIPPLDADSCTHIEGDVVAFVNLLQPSQRGLLSRGAEERRSRGLGRNGEPENRGGRAEGSNPGPRFQNNLSEATQVGYFRSNAGRPEIFPFPLLTLPCPPAVGCPAFPDHRDRRNRRQNSYACSAKMCPSRSETGQSRLLNGTPCNMGWSGVLRAGRSTQTISPAMA